MKLTRATVSTVKGSMPEASGNARALWTERRGLLLRVMDDAGNVAVTDQHDAAADAGRVFVDSAGFTGMPGREWTYGTACPGSAGLPRMWGIGSPLSRFL